MDAVLQRAASSYDAAECHVFLSGLICAAGFADPKIWVSEMFDAYNPKDLLQAEAFRSLQGLYENTLARLNSPDLDFELLLPDDSFPLRERTEALGSWCSGFLSGLGMGGLPPADQLPDEVAELLDDLSKIAQVDFEVDQPDEDERHAYEDIVEYIRVGVLYIHEELQPGTAPAQLQ
jgi:yecA family protein